MSAPTTGTAAGPPRADAPADSRLLFYLPLALYLGIHLLLRLGISSTLQHDEAEQPVLSQSLAWGYSGQPPLYTWLVWSLAQVFGMSTFTLSLLKTGILAAIYVLLYRCAYLVLEDMRRAALAAGSLLLVPMFAWEFLRDFTHSPLLCAVSLATVYVVLRLPKAARGIDYMLLGATLGLGVLAKYNFVHFAAALMSAALTIAPFRRRLLDRRIMLSLALAAVIVLPHALWLRGHWGLVHGFLNQRMGVGQAGSYPQGVVRGCSSLVYNILLFLTPLWVSCLVFFPAGFRRTATRLDLSADRQLLLQRFFLTSFLVLLVQIIHGGTTRFYVHWLEPFLVLLPIWFFGRLRGLELSMPRLRGFAGVLGLSAVLIMGVRACEGWLDLNASKHSERDQLFQQQVAELRQAGFQNGTLVAGDHVIAGNLRLYFPGARVLCAKYPAYEPPATAGPIVVVWNATVCDSPLPDLTTYVRDKLGLCLSRRTPARHLGDRNTEYHRHMNRLGYAFLPANDEVPTGPRLAHKRPSPTERSSPADAPFHLSSFQKTAAPRSRKAE